MSNYFNVWMTTFSAQRHCFSINQSVKPPVLYGVGMIKQQRRVGCFDNLSEAIETMLNVKYGYKNAGYNVLSLADPYDLID